MTPHESIERFDTTVLQLKVIHHPLYPPNLALNEKPFRKLQDFLQARNVPWKGKMDE